MKLRYIGPPGMAIAGIGQLEPGESYELDAEEGERLLESPHWQKPGGRSKDAKKDDDAESGEEEAS